MKSWRCFGFCNSERIEQNWNIKLNQSIELREEFNKRQGTLQQVLETIHLDSGKHNKYSKDHRVGDYHKLEYMRTIYLNIIGF